MNTMSRTAVLKFSAMIFALGLVFLSSITAYAQDESPDTYPSRPVRLIVPYAPTGSTDAIGRLVADILTKELNQSFVVVNVLGASGIPGAVQVAHSKSDGYTLMVGTPGIITNNLYMYKDIGYDPVKDFKAITSLWSMPTVIAVRKDGPFTNLKELIAEAKRRPGALNFGTSGMGASDHLAAELFSSLTGIKMTHIPYKGMAPAILDVIGKNVDVVFAPLTMSNHPQLLGLAIAARTRSSFIPAVPTAAEAGVTGYEYNSWGGLFAPAGISPRIAEKLSLAIAKGSAVESAKKRYTALGVDPEFSSPTKYEADLAAESKRQKQLIESIGLGRAQQ